MIDLFVDLLLFIASIFQQTPSNTMYHPFIHTQNKSIKFFSCIQDDLLNPCQPIILSYLISLFHLEKQTAFN